MKKDIEEKLSIEIYKPQKGLPSVKVHFDKDTVWLTQQQMGDLFKSSRVNVTEHIKHIYDDKELSKKATCRKIRLVRTEGKRQVKREIDHYNLDMFISVGYRVNSKTATQFLF